MVPHDNLCHGYNNIYNGYNDIYKREALEEYENKKEYLDLLASYNSDL